MDIDGSGSIFRSQWKKLTSYILLTVAEIRQPKKNTSIYILQFKSHLIVRCGRNQEGKERLNIFVNGRSRIFPRWGRQLSRVANTHKIFLKTAWNQKNLDARGMGAHFRSNWYGLPLVGLWLLLLHMFTSTAKILMVNHIYKENILRVEPERPINVFTYCKTVSSGHLFKSL